ncbi:unnamed protein product [Clonostachys rhizophaga]|uniref:Uncharacterized protein n=1 Tax=Clonostachys rhizophaga TaxID=160324 RepID=A0A9N9VXW7_9HYPO|nr:unnamed protein product [Clonostachys rhizophaga]
MDQISNTTQVLPFWGSMSQIALVEQWKLSLLGSIVTSVLVALLISSQQPQLKVPILLEKELKTATERAKKYSESARELLLRGHNEFGKQPWGITTHNGESADTNTLIPGEIRTEHKPDLIPLAREPHGITTEAERPSPLISNPSKSHRNDFNHSV